VAKARVNLKGINKAVDRLTSQLERLEQRPAAGSARREINALHRKLTRVKALLADECPQGMFREFEFGARTAARKTTRKGSRKVR